MNKVRPTRFRNILITGLPGVGKSTFARAYAQLSRTEFVELDKYVERLAGKSIAEIFNKDGEEAFRELEANCLERLLKRQRCTVALGGGTLTNPRSLQLAQELGCIVLLSASVGDVASRLWEQKQSRPLLKDCETPAALEQRLEELWNERKDSYCAADIVLDMSHSSIDNLKIELAWLERQVLSGFEGSNEDTEASLFRAIPMADPSYRSPREQRGGGEIVDKMERFLKSQKQKDRGERKDRRDRKGNRPIRGLSDEVVHPDSNLSQLAGPRPRIDGPQPRVEGPQPRVEGPQPRAEGPQPRAEGPHPRAEGPHPRAEGPRPRAEGPRPRAEGPQSRSGAPQRHGDAQRHRRARQHPRSDVSNNRAQNSSNANNTHSTSSADQQSATFSEMIEKLDD